MLVSIACDVTDPSIADILAVYPHDECRTYLRLACSKMPLAELLFVALSGWPRDTEWVLEDPAMLYIQYL